MGKTLLTRGRIWFLSFWHTPGFVGKCQHFLLKFSLICLGLVQSSRCPPFPPWLYVNGPTRIGCSANLPNSLITLSVQEGRIYAVYIHSSCLYVTRGYPHPVNTQFSYAANPGLYIRGTDWHLAASVLQKHKLKTRNFP